MEGGSAIGSASTVSDDDNFVVSSEDSSCPEETLELGLGLSLGLKGKQDARVSYAEDSSSSSSSSLCRASVTAGIKRTADSMAATSGQVVGWPPIRTYRMNNMINQAKSVATEEMNSEIQKNVRSKNSTDSRRDVKFRNSLFVKVNMDGIPIGRKIDLKAHRCYESLSKALEEMFLKPSAGSGSREHDAITKTQPAKLLDGSSGFVLTYEDKEGDWMLVGDVPWGLFLGSVRRLRIMRTSEATGNSQRIA